jgi:preprotein translocase subunit SecD
MKQYRTFIIIIVLLIVSIWIDIPSNPGIHLLGANKDIKTHLGLDLVGGVQVLLEADVPLTQQVSDAEMNAAKTIVENRVNGLGVTEAVVTRAGSRRIVVELPGVADQEQAKATVKQTALLEFVDMSSITQAEAISYKDANTSIVTDYNPTGVITPTTGVIIPTTGVITPTAAVSQTQKVWHTVMTGKQLKNAVVSVQTGKYEVSFELTSDGATVFKDFTSSHIGQVLAIVLDKKIISAPTINDAIPDGKGIISGNFTPASANQLAVQLRYGALPIPLKIVESNSVGPTLGQDSLRRSLIAGAIGLGLVVIFMALYYRLPGIVADLALMTYALIAYALFRFIPITLTLPGIGGFVLSIGMAVDANILIFERLKEELRAGRSLRTAIDLGWRRAWSSIRDSNLSTLITCFILYYFGTTFGASIVKGFSLTLALGVLVSLFTAIIVTRTFLHLVMDNIKSVEHPKWFGI